MSAARRLASLLARTLAVLVPVGVAVAIAVAMAAPGVTLGREAEQAFMDARAFRAELVERAERPPVTHADTAGLLALGYMERARLGMGSPFRLADLALADPRLPDSTRRSTAWTILAMVYDRDVYESDPAALDSAFVAGASMGTLAGGREQLRQMERTMAKAGDARAGELAVRFAYQLAEAERLVRGSAALSAARVAAQLRDRELAHDDLLRLLRAAREEERDPLALVPVWRLARRLAVEQPVLGRLDANIEAEAVALAPALVAEIRRVAHMPADSVALLARMPVSPADERVRLLSPRAATHLAALPQVRSLPPRAPVVVALAASRDQVVSGDALPRHVRQARLRFLDAATEEVLVAEHARLGEAAGRRLSQAMLWAATSLRGYAQERPWFPGSGGPTADELRARHGIAVVSFDREVPAEWRPYYRRMLGEAVEDMQRALPDFSVKGLGVHFGRQPIASALAVHDPRTRTIFLPLGTGAGAIAHELAHDLDWQVAAREPRRRGEYSTDQAVRERRGRMATALQGLSAAVLVAPGPENQYRAPHALRPAEVFASSVDWYVAAALARDGRSNGYLSGVQDDLFTGFAAVRPPDARGEAGDATMEVLGQMTRVPAETERWFRGVYGRERTMGTLERAARVLTLAPALAGQRPAAAAPVVLREHGAPLMSLRPNAPLASDAPWSALPAPCVAREVDASAGAAASRNAVELAAEAVARRLVAERGVTLPAGGHLQVRPDGTPVAPGDPALVEREIARLRNQLLHLVHHKEAAAGWGGPAVDYRGRC